MNGIEKIIAELHVMLKTTEDCIKKNINHVMMVQKEKKKRKRWILPRAKARKMFLMSPRALSLK
jgi:hypothetical protein